MTFSAYLEAFEQHEPLRQRVLYVLCTLPKEVQQDFLSDPRFTVSLDNYVPGEGSTVFMAAPGETGDGSRSVVLKPRLSECPEAFAHYVIAHEFAHAYLRNGPSGESPMLKTWRRNSGHVRLLTQCGGGSRFLIK